MTPWRPPAAIRVKVIGLPFRENHLFACEVLDDSGALSGVRPLGGTIEFGETRESALMREFAEELGCGIEIAGPWTAFENIFVHEGAAGHEFLFAAPIRLVGRDIALTETVAFAEHDGSPCRARWFRVEALKRGAPRLYPAGLGDMLDALVPPL